LQESYEKLRQILGLNWEVSKIGPQVCNVLHADRGNAGRKKSPKIRHLRPSHNFVGPYLCN